MTTDNLASRWLAKWFMRLEASGTLLRLILFGGTFLTTGLSALAQYGYGDYAPHFIVTVGTGTIAFAYYYTSGGIFNQKNRDKTDAGQNFAGPEQLIDDILIGTAHFAAREGRPPTDQEQAAIRKAVTDQWREFRDGVDIESLVTESSTSMDQPGQPRAVADGGTPLAAVCADCNQHGDLGTHKGVPVVACPGCNDILYRPFDTVEVAG
ncbi:hypothetical protein HTZ84_22615 [Haloterrigena sp. SYSU A558-1]|uniref:Uncharacterized protein n=1 Tax=Haloterrigena gelatinilytica TaxID=2741724 RepID=A0ABX2LN22_9EURY|nr:hypothetical protein [Haloterrigena gelatinilytica]NUC75062.1 hypothetical protein [Haloterrigena gelatinilytica]